MANLPRTHGLADLAEFKARLAELREVLEPPTESGEFIAHTDGACIGNPDGPGGWAAVVDQLAPVQDWELWGHLSSTSNNRAEALGVLAALEWVPVSSTLLLRSDSELTIKIIEGLYKAKANPDIWTEIRRVRMDKPITLRTEWVRGHAGDAGNERADYLSRLGAANGDVVTAERFGNRPARASGTLSELVGVVAQSTWEHEFLKSVARQLRGGRALSPKQQAIVERMRARGA